MNILVENKFIRSWAPMFFLIILFAGGAILLAIIGYFGRENFLASLFGPADFGRTIFANLKRSRLPIDALCCPQGFCPLAKSDFSAPVYNLPVEALREKFRTSLRQEKHLEKAHTNDPALRERYVQRSELFRFADTIQVEFIAIDARHATLAIYSKSQFGLSDGGVNRKRIRRWLRKLEKLLT